MIRAPLLRTLLATAAVPALFLPGLAAAQDAADPPGTTVLNRVVLTAGREKVAIDTPQAVTVIDQDDLDEEQAGSIDRIFANVPGVQGAGASNPLGFAFNIRGIGATETTASEARIIVNVDGVPKFYEQYRMGSFFSDVELYKQVEVLRGPASSTLYGSGAIGGVVNFTTKDAADFLAEGNDSALRFKLGYDSNGKGWLGSAIFAQRYDENFEVIGNLNYRTSDEYKDGDGNPVKGSDARAWSGLVKGTYAFDEAQRLRFSWQRTQSDIDESPVVRTGGGAIVDAFGFVDRDVKDDTFLVTYENDAPDNPWLDLTLSLGYSDTRVEQSNATMAYMCAFGGTLEVMCDVTYAYETFVAKAENVFEISSGDWQNYVTTGIQYTHQDRVADSDGLLSFHPEGTDEKIGLYAQGEFVWADRLTIIPGLRADFGDRTPKDVPDAESVTDTVVSPKIAALYQLTDAWGVFGSLSRTERMPTLDELYSYDAFRTPAMDLDKETADTIELGVTFQQQDLISAGDQLALKGTLFSSDIKNLIASTASGIPGPRYENIANAEIWGGELEGAYSADLWFARLAYSNTTARDKDTKTLLSTSPADAVSLTLGGRLAEAGLEYGWRATFVDSITTPLGAFSAYDVHRIFASWTPRDGALEGFRVDVAVDNVFDEQYQNNLYQDAGRGRSFQLSLTKQFDW